MSSQTFLIRNAPIPFQDRISRAKRNDLFGRTQDDPLEGKVTDSWADFLSKLTFTVQASATRLNSVSKLTQSAAIGATDMTGGNLKAGIYRLTYYTRVTLAAGAGSSLQVTVTWTDGGTPQPQAGAALITNTLTTMETRSFMFHADAGSPVTYQTAYASGGAPSMEYRLDVILENLES